MSFRDYLLACLTPCLLVSRAAAGELRHYDDATLRAVQFVDDQEGWAVGDEGAVWHTIDGGKSWDRQPSGVRASLRSVHFLNPYTGWVAGREELPGGQSGGVLLYTSDGGVKWRRLLLNALPGLHAVRFADEKTGFLAGEGADGYPSGVFRTADGGRTWQPVPGPRAPGWLGLAAGADGAVLTGAWNKLATVRGERLHLADVDALGGRNVTGLFLAGKRGVAVGPGGLVLTTETAGSSWSYAELRLPAGVRQAWDFQAVHGAAGHVWVVGRPGSVVLHSADGGASWEVQKTGQPLPLHGVYFRDAAHGWAVGALGTVLATTDGGRSWKVLKRGGERAAVLLAHARPAAVPLDAAARLGAQDGYLAAAVAVIGPDPATAAPARAGEAARFAAAFRHAGGAAAESLWQFPLPAHLAHADRGELLKAWDRLHDDRAGDQLLRQLVLALRLWRPDVVLTDLPEAGPERQPPDRSNATADAPHAPAEALIAEAVREAFRRAGDPQAFAEQLSGLGLAPWRPSKLYGLCPSPAGAAVTLDATAIQPVLEGTVAEFVAAPAALLGAAVPAQRHYRLLADHQGGADAHRDLMQGVDLAPGGLARRPLARPDDLADETIKAIRQRANLRAMAELPPGGPAGPERVLAQLGPMLADMPDEHAARAAHAVAAHLARSGQWALAREVYQFVADRYPAHPLALEAYRWLARHDSSSEARRRHELGQFIVATQLETGQPAGPVERAAPKNAREAPKPPPDFEVRRTSLVQVLGDRAESRKWYQGALDIEPRLAGFGPLFANDPALQFCLQAARRNLGDFDTAADWYREFAARQPDGPWRACALAELWLANRQGPAPKPLAYCRHAAERPFLDGKLDDACWQGGKAARLQPAAGREDAEYPAEVRLAYDREFLYVALKCGHPAGRRVPPVKGRSRDAELRGHDRVCLSFDLDRDYATAFHFRVDQRGCVAEDCWGDKTWNPRWFVAVDGGETGWTAELAIPLTALTGDVLTAGRVWAFNAVRVVPGRGVQAFSLPADAPEEAPRPEGMGLLQFVQDVPPLPMPPAP